MEKDLREALYKKAVGYTAEETVEEYSDTNDMIKRKVTTKYYPPDITAMKMYADIVGDGADIYAMSDEELEKERRRLIEALKESNDENCTRKY